MSLPRGLPPAAAAAAVGMWAVSAPLAAASGSEGIAFAILPVPFVAMALVGGIVGAPRPGNATGWLFLGAGFLMMLNALAQGEACGRRPRDDIDRDTLGRDLRAALAGTIQPAQVSLWLSDQRGRP